MASIIINGIEVQGPMAIHESITAYRWTDGGKEVWWPKPTMVQWLSETGNEAFVIAGGRRVDVRLVREPGKLPYLRTWADGYYYNNLLALPRRS